MELTEEQQADEGIENAHNFDCIDCEDGHNLIRGLECFHCGNTKVKYYKKEK